VSATLDAGDYETRYDLGIAYREMGLFEDAIGEFRICLECPSRRFDSLCMMGLCAFDLGRFRDAVSHLEQALSSGDWPAAQQAGVTFDLARAYGAAGDLARARDAYARVGELSPDFPGLDEAVAALTAGDDGAQPDDEPAQALESFGDLMSEMDSDEVCAEEAPAETFENFDDVITDAEAAYSEAPRIDRELPAEIETAEVEAAEIVAEEPEPDPVAGPATPAAATGPVGRKPPRKKKISFV
jgi:tetratricopeptide (TPR) repeat protein